MISTGAALGNLAAAVCFILALKGLSSPTTARRGNLVGAAGAALAVIVVFSSGDDFQRVGLIVVALLIGAVVGWVFARRVQMTQMPQLVALFKDRKSTRLNSSHRT